MNHLNTKIIASNVLEKIELVDTPGLIDGDVQYRYDVSTILKFFASQSDLILVFLDPQGQAFCQRTMDLVDDLYHHYENKI